MAATEKTVAGTALGLRRDAIGLREVLFTDVGLVHLDAVEEGTP